jgi:hypothetical protein
MSLGGVYLIREPLLRGLLIATGVFFIGVAAVILATHSWQPEESRFVLLIPFLAGVLLLAIATAFRGNALRSALFLFFAIPAFVMLLLKITCTTGVLSGGVCV